MTTRREFLQRTTTAAVLAGASIRIAKAWQADLETGAPNAMRAGAVQTVQTVLGPRDVAKLGFTLSHEHICSIPRGLFNDRASAVTKMVGKLKEAKAAGISTIIDCTTFDVAPDAKVGWQRRASYIKQLVAAGFGDKIFLSNDWELDRENINPDGLLFNTRKTIPYLKQIGVSEREIHSITVENPRRFFGRSS